MKFSYSHSFAFAILLEVWGVDGAPAFEAGLLSATTGDAKRSEDIAYGGTCSGDLLDCNSRAHDDSNIRTEIQNAGPSAIEPVHRIDKNPLDQIGNLQKRAEGGNSTFMTAAAAIIIIVLLIALIVGGIYFLRKHTRSKVREIELKPSVSRAGDRDRDPSIRSSTMSTATDRTDDFLSKETSPSGIIIVERAGTSAAPHSSSSIPHKRSDEESAIGISKEHPQNLRHAAGSPIPSTHNNENSTAPLVSGSQHNHNPHQATNPGHKRRISTQQHQLPANRRLSVQTTFRGVMLEHSSGSPLSASKALEAYEHSQTTRSPLKSPVLHKTPRARD